MIKTEVAGIFFNTNFPKVLHFQVSGKDNTTFISKFCVFIKILETFCNGWELERLAAKIKFALLE